MANYPLRSDGSTHSDPPTSYLEVLSGGYSNVSRKDTERQHEALAREAELAYLREENARLRKAMVQICEYIKASLDR